MKFPFNELDYDNLYPLTLKLDTGNIYEGRFTDLRIDRSSIPKNLGLYAYDIRDECDADPCEVRNFILVNHMGTLFTTEPIPEAEKGEGYVVDAEKMSASELHNKLQQGYDDIAVGQYQDAARAFAIHRKGRQ